MISSSQDIFYLVLAFCILWFTIFVCWLLYYFIAIFKEMRGTARDFRERLQKIGSALEEIKEKFTSSLSIFSGLADGVKYGVGYLVDRRNDHRASAPAKSKKRAKKAEEEQSSDEAES